MRLHYKNIFYFPVFQPDISDKSISEATGSAGYSLDILFFSYYMYFPPFHHIEKIENVWYFNFVPCSLRIHFERGGEGLGAVAG